MEDKYKVISCHLYDKLESFAVKKTKLKISYLEDLEEKNIEDYIVNFKTKNKEEFMILKSGITIRLDNIIKTQEI